MTGSLPTANKTNARGLSGRFEVIFPGARTMTH